MAQRDWDGEWRTGCWDFLAGRPEQERLRQAARMIAEHGPGPLIDLGSGDGQLLRHLDPRRVPACLCVDISQTALRRVDGGGGIVVDRLVGDLNDLKPEPRPAAALVCTEILYYLDAPDTVLARWASACTGLQAVVVSLAEPSARFPQWRVPVERAWQAMKHLGWPVIETAETVADDGVQRWAVCAYRPSRTG